MRLITYCLMPNHWHLVLYPRDDRSMGSYMKWITQRHTQHWHIEHKSIGTGHLYQGRYKSFPVESNEYLIQLIRYVERNPLRARLVSRAEAWQWSGLWRRMCGADKGKRLLCEIPTELPHDYLAWVNEKEDEEALRDIRSSIAHNTPYGSDAWTGGLMRRKSERNGGVE